VSEASAVIDIVGPHDGPDKFLKEIVFFIGALGRRKPSKLVSFVMNQGTGYVLDRLLPVDLNKFSFPLDQRGCYRLACLSSFVNAVCDPLKGVVCPHERGG
jgi:hypothetical protein